MSKSGRGHLRIYLGAAPGVGKTYKMLGEGQRRLARGTDVVVGFVETHGREHTAEMLAGPRGGTAPDPRLPRRELHRDGPRRRAGPAAGGGAGRRTGAHQRAGQPEREALAGHRGAAVRRDRRDLGGQHPAPRVDQRRGREDHRRTAAGDRPGPGGPGRRPDRAGRHDPGGAAPPDGPRQRLRGGQDRCCPGQLLPRRQPVRPARTRVALARRPGGRRPAAVPCPT